MDFSSALNEAAKNVPNTVGGSQRSKIPPSPCFGPLLAYVNQPAARASTEDCRIAVNRMARVVEADVGKDASGGGGRLYQLEGDVEVVDRRMSPG
jgi:hypothetical protein